MEEHDDAVITSRGMDDMDVMIVPQPRRIVYGQGSVELPLMSRICEQVDDPSCVLARQLADDLRDAAGLHWTVAKGARWRSFITLSVDEHLETDEYRLDIDADGIGVRGGGFAAVRDGVQTLRQIIRQCAPALPVMRVEDGPAFITRGSYLDATRGRVPTLDWLKRWADLLCLYKYNQLQLYVEHSFAFDGFEEVWRGSSPLTTSDIVAFDAYCAERGIELVPSVSTFGHHYMALRSRSFRELGEFPEQADRPFSFIERQEHHTLNITDERAFDFSCSLIDSYLELFRSRKFNICADETFDLGKGQGRSEADRIGVATMYAGFVTRLCKHLSDLGHEPMMWGDIAVEMPRILSMLPDDVCLLNWLYDPHVDDEKVRLVAQSGARQIVCPAVWGWNSLLGRPHDAWLNISRLASYGRRYGAEGMLVTDWGDYGHINDPRLSIPGMLYGAEYAWNPESTLEEDELNRRISSTVYADAGGTVMQALSQVSRAVSFGWDHAVAFKELDNGHGGVNHDVLATLSWITGETVPDELSTADLHTVRRWFLKQLDDRLRLRERHNETLAHFPESLRAVPGDAMFPMLVGAQGQRLWNDVGCALAKGDPDSALAVRLERWFETYATAWRQVSSQSELERIRNVIYWYADLLRNGLKKDVPR